MFVTDLYQIIGVTIQLTSWDSNYVAPALSASASQLARNMFVSFYSSPPLLVIMCSCAAEVIDHFVASLYLVRRLASNSVDFAIGDSAQNLQDGINTPDMASIPFAAQALVLVYNLPGIADGSLTLSMDLVTRIMLGNITSWKDPSIVTLNPGVALPDVNVLDHACRIALPFMLPHHVSAWLYGIR
jgi:hypothetical protein